MVDELTIFSVKIMHLCITHNVFVLLQVAVVAVAVVTLLPKPPCALT